MSAPQGLAADTSGNLFIADTNNSRVLMVPATSGTYFNKAMVAGSIYTIADGSQGLHQPKRLTVDPAGNVLVGDAGIGAGSTASAVWIVFRTAGTDFGVTGTVGEVAQVPTAGMTLNDVHGVRVDAFGNLIIANGGFEQILIIAGSTGTYYGISMVKGKPYQIKSPTPAGWNPVEAVPDQAGNLVIDDYTGYLWVLAGTDNSRYGQDMKTGLVYRISNPAIANPNSVDVDQNDGSLVVADPINNEVDRITTAGAFSVIAGNANSSTDSGDGGPAASATLGQPSSVLVDAGGDILVSEGIELAGSGGQDGNRVREIVESSTPWPPTGVTPTPPTTTPPTTTPPTTTPPTTTPPTTTPPTTTPPTTTPPTTTPPTTTPPTTAPPTTAPPTTTPPSSPPPPANPTAGYWLFGANGDVYPEGNAPFEGSVVGALNAPIVGGAEIGTGSGYWLVAGDGGVFSFGDAHFHGSAGGLRLNQPVVGMAPTKDGQGYWLFARDGGVFSYGDAQFYGSMGGTPLNAPIVGGVAAPDGNGYYLVASDGGVFAFGSAVFHGSAGSLRLNQPVVGMSLSPNGGYWLVARDGGIFTYGGAPFLGSTGGVRLNAPVTGMASSRAGGYWLVANDGGVFTFGVPFEGSLGGRPPGDPIEGILPTP